MSLMAFTTFESLGPVNCIHFDSYGPSVLPGGLLDPLPPDKM